MFSWYHEFDIAFQMSNFYPEAEIASLGDGVALEVKLRMFMYLLRGGLGEYSRNEKLLGMGRSVKSWELIQLMSKRRLLKRKN